jgi:hypothetical protein
MFWRLKYYWRPHKNTLACVRRVKGIYLQAPPTDGSPWVGDCRSFDIPNTIAAMINNAAPGLIAVTLSPRGGAAMIKAAEHAARKRGIRILWWTYDPNRAIK